MMANKWVQASLMFGFVVGLWISVFVNIIHPLASFCAAYVLIVPLGWLVGRARSS